MVMNSTTMRTSMRTAFYISVVLTISVIMLGWWSMNEALLVTYGDRLIVIGRLFGLLAAWSVIVQIILMSRVPFIERNFDLQENVQLHTYNGYVLLATITGHVVFLVLGYALPAHINFFDQFVTFNTQYQDVFLATVGTLIFFVASFLSLHALRSKMKYEIWYAIHITIHLGILMTFLHQVKTGNDFIHNFWFTAFWYGLYILAFVVWLRYRILHPVILAYKYRFRVESVMAMAAHTYSIRLVGRNVSQFEFEPGQYATWRFLAKGLWYEAHPFSISSPQGANYVQFTVKASPMLTEKIANVQPGTYVIVDGPRGSFTSERADETSKVVLIAGGIGVAPYLSMIGDFLRKGKDVMLLYSARSEADVAFRSELIQLQSQGLKVGLYLNEVGQSIGPEVLAGISRSDTTIYICGPDGMSRAFVATLRSLGFSQESIITERFAF